MEEKVKLKGHSTEFALRKLIGEVKAVLATDVWTKERWKSIVTKSFTTSNESSLFPWPCMCLTILYFVMLFVVGVITSDAWQIFEAILIFVFLVVNVFINVANLYLTEVEMYRRVADVVAKLEMYLANGISWSQENYPHLHTPISASVVLQWTIRDGTKVNLPWALLVENDLIYLKPGQVAPGKCRSHEDPKIVVNKGEILHLLPDHPGTDVSPIPEFKPPVKPQLFILEETPYVRSVKSVLTRAQLERPSSRLNKYQHIFFVQLLAQLLAPASLILTLICNIVSFYHQESTHDHIYDMIITNPIATALPMVSLSFPLYWIVANYMALAKIMNDYLSFRHVHVTDDPFDDTPGHQQPNLILEKAKEASDASLLRTSFFSALLGHGKYLSRTENLIHALGSITALCCTDKKGILSWPNTSAEKLFILKSEEAKQVSKVMTTSSGDAASVHSETFEQQPEKPETTIVPEILTVTHDHRNPFKVDFDDPSWRQYMHSLKPLGLSILLNTCNLSTEENYTNFFNYLICESIRLDNQSKMQETHSHEGEHDRNHHVGIELLPIVTRGCLCELAKKIGFDTEQTDKGYQFSNQVQTFRHVWGSDTGTTTKFIRNLHLAHLKFPFPHMVSVTMREKGAVPSNHLISQGTADIILDSCIDAWTGKDLASLSEDTRKKILDFYQRASLSSYCTAFSYRPLLMPLPWKNVDEYLQLPSHTYPFYWQYTDNAEMADADAVQNKGHISLGNAAHAEQKDEKHSKTLDDALACLELECNQTFLGMVQMQYQALVDIVQLIDLLEKACIRFVHFSKENELRSRVFSEKMGLESGWNCHISLTSHDNAAMRKTVSYHCPPGYQPGRKKCGKRAAVAARNNKLIGCSLPDKLERHPWYLDFPRWHETRKGTNNGDKTFASAAQLRAATLQSDEHRNSSVSCRASVTSDSDPFDYDMSNRAQLPKGIENIRPHLETMDNVPLLVSLFTDCTPDNTREMIMIMQDYGEVVCVLGSAANHHNTRVFMQADASLAIEPLYPQVCQDVPVYKTPANCPSPTNLSQMLNSVASSLSFHMEDEVSIFHLILESRHFSLCLLNAMQFWTSCLIFIMLAQISSQFMTLPLFLTPGQTLWLTILVIPMLSMSLLGPNSPDKDVMNISTGKNQVVVDKSSVKYSLSCYGLKFTPALATLILCQGLANQENLCNNHLNLVMTVAYILAISLSFLFRGQHLWQRHPGNNTVYLWTVLGICVVQGIYSFLVVYFSEDFRLPSESCWIVWGCGLPFVIAFNEIIKRYEIKGEVRYQKRQRLEFGTKLGINSPF